MIVIVVVIETSGLQALDKQLSITKYPSKPRFDNDHHFVDHDHDHDWISKQKIPGLYDVSPGMPFFTRFGCLFLRPKPRKAFLQPSSRQVFWLPVHPNHRAFPSLLIVAFQRLSSPVTAAGPRRILTVFPIITLKWLPAGSTFKEDSLTYLLSFVKKDMDPAGTGAWPVVNFPIRITGKVIWVVTTKIVKGR